MTIRIKNWAKFQHFKDRRPPWVKLYRDLLDDREWHKLDGDSAKMLVSMWLIGSENNGELPELEELAFRLRLDEKLVQKCLGRLGHWLISERYQGDINVSQKISATDIEMPLRDREETETETEEEEETEKKRAPRSAIQKPDSVEQQTWDDFLNLRKAKKAPVSHSAITRIANEAQKADMSLGEALEIMCSRGWTGFKAEWVDNQPVKQSESFAERDARLAREKAQKWAPYAAEQDPYAPFVTIKEVINVPAIECD